jgi:DNA-binding NarL/FixJ family response regulator
MNVVMCDDHRLFTDVLVDALHHKGHMVCAVSAGLEDTVAAVRKYRPSVCLVDLRLPGASGLEVAAAIRQISPGTAIILLTGASGAEVWPAVDDRAVDAAVSKDCQLSILDRTIRAARAGGPVVAVGWTRNCVRGSAGAEDRQVTLTERETAVLDLLQDGLSNDAIAQELGISINTVRTHLHNLFAKLHVSTRARAVRRALELGVAVTGVTRRTASGASNAR